MAVLITLTGNVLHCIDKDIIGIIYARIMLIQTTMFFVPKEALRRACMRNLLKHSWPELLNFIWLM